MTTNRSNLVPGRTARLTEASRIELWPVRGGWPGPGSAPWRPRYMDGPARFMVLARLTDPYGYDDLLVLGTDGRTGWTYVDPARTLRPMHLADPARCRPRAGGGTTRA